MPARAVLIGAPGAGKSTVAAELARLWECGHIDTDARVEEMAGLPVSDIFTTLGEPAFREMEARACLDAFASDGCVVSVGGGAVTTAEVREALSGLPIVWLKATVADIASRVSLDVPRPLLLGNVRRQLIDLLAARTPIYESLATLAVETSGATPSQIAATIVEEMTRGGRGA